MTFGLDWVNGSEWKGNIKNNNEKCEDLSHYYKEREPVSPLTYINEWHFLRGTLQLMHSLKS